MFFDPSVLFNLPGLILVAIAVILIFSLFARFRDFRESRQQQRCIDDMQRLLDTQARNHARQSALLEQKLQAEEERNQSLTLRLERLLQKPSRQALHDLLFYQTAERLLVERYPLLHTTWQQALQEARTSQAAVRSLPDAPWLRRWFGGLLRAARPLPRPPLIEMVKESAAG